MKNYIQNYNEFVNESINEAWIGPFVFNEDMSDDELKAIYQGALDGFAYWQKGFEYPKADYKKAYQEIGKILKKRGVNVDESEVNEASKDEMVKKEAISRLADFFRVSPGPLMKFKFDGNDNIKELTRVLNSTSDEGTELYYKTAIKLAQEEVGFDESVNEGFKTGQFVRYKKDDDFTGGKIIAIKGNKAEIHNWDGSTIELSLSDLEYVKSWNEAINEGAVKAFELDYSNLVKNIKTGYGWIDPEFVEQTWENTGNSISFDIVKDEIYNRLIKAGLLYFSDDNDPEEKGKKVTNISQIK